MRFFSKICQSNKLYLLILIFLILNGCSGKQGAEAVLTVPAKPADTSSQPLTEPEKAALRSKGHVDKNIPEQAMADVSKEYTYFLREGRKTMSVFSRQSEQYLAYARKVFRSRGMPEELANLAIVESGYRPDAVSRAGAAGAWQFMPQTGMRYGLAQDWWQDERLDPYHATEAAADYLQRLYNAFGDWPTAIAAYNAGEGKISRAKEGTGGKDFFEVNSLNHTLDDKARLRDETKQYVPRFIAVTKIMRNLPELGFEPIDPKQAEPISRYTAEPGTDLLALSKACNLSWEEFNRYNMHHKRNITCTNRKTFVYVPTRAEKLASAYLCDYNKANYANWQPVKVRGRAETLEKISKRSNIPLARLQAANPGVSRLAAGQIIIAPQTVNLTPAPEPAARGKNEMAGGGVHVVKAKETLFGIAKKYNVSVAELREANGLGNSALHVGGKLIIPGKSPARGGSTGSIGKRRSRYVVQANDSLWNIAKRHNISVADLKRWNKINEKSLRPGIELVVSEETR